jgi:hypothetical protein
LQADWTLRLDLSRKLVGTKQRTVASAQLVLPNGDTIQYRERVVQYSALRGYSLSFVHGTNVTLNPPSRDRKSSIVIKGMTLVQEGADWEPSGGSIRYQFLGQRGTANLMDFLAP